ncbi:MAG TPA: hypothetical protein VFK90_16065, partial [Anaeromyxobacter sp.]|nr:hypothetical protein [Anaeromyxobacter sp.]
MSVPRFVAVLASALLLALAGCHSGKTSGTLGVSAKGDGSAGIASVEVGGGVSVSRVRVLVRQLELEGAEGDQNMPMPTPMMAADHGGGDGGEGEENGVEIGPLVVDVSGDALSGSVKKVFDADVPEGTYRELKIAIGPSSGAAPGTPLAAMGASSIVVDGTKAGAPFSFASALQATQKLETPLVVDHAGKSSNVTLVLEVTKWFTAAGGGPLDPTADADRAAIEANMLANLRFERDDDENGVD